MKNLVYSFVISLILIIATFTPAYAITERPIYTLQYTTYQNGLPIVSVDDISTFASRKGFEVVHLLQVIAQPFAIVIFIIAAFITLIGTLGNKHLATKGMITMILSCLCYSAILYAPVILQGFVGFVGS